jgi:ankyrin repeat protein
MAVARFFLDKGADPNKQAQDGLVPLHEAAREGLTFCTCLDFYRHFVTTFSL